MDTAPPMRFLVQSIEGEWLHLDFPLVDVEITTALSGPCEIAGKLDPEQADLVDIPLIPWGTWIWAEQDGQIRAGGILQPTSLEGESLDITAVGFSEYAKQVPFRGAWELGSPVGIGIDPIDAFRYLWDYIQQMPDRDLGITYDNTKSKVKWGTPQTDGDNDSGPYKLDWWESKNTGEELERLVTDTPFDYREKYSWNADRTEVRRHIQIGYPKLGRRRTDLRFAQDENIDNLVSVGEDPELFATRVFVHGRGEGSAMVWGKAEKHIEGVLPVAVVIEDKTLATRDACNKLASEELAKRSGAIESRLVIEEIEMPWYNAHAPLGSFDVGDEILITSDFAWRGRTDLWHRITGITLNVDEETMKLTLRREALND